MLTLLDAWPSLIGTAIGAAAAIGGGVVGQTAISRREAKDRARKEARVRALFITHSKTCLMLAEWQIETASVPLDELDATAEPLRRFLSDQSLVLALEPDAIDAVTTAVHSLDLGVRVARAIRSRSEQRSAQQPGRTLEILDSDDLQVKSVFQNPVKNFKIALLRLGDSSEQ